MALLKKKKNPICSVNISCMTQLRSAKCPSFFVSWSTSAYGLTFWIWATNAAPLLKLCSDASASERLLRDPALPVNSGVGSVPEGSYCWLEGHFPFNTTWQILSRRLIITRSCKKKKKGQKLWEKVPRVPSYPNSQSPVRSRVKYSNQNELKEKSTFKCTPLRRP